MMRIKIKTRKSVDIVLGAYRFTNRDIGLVWRYTKLDRKADTATYIFILDSSGKPYPENARLDKVYDLREELGRIKNGTYERAPEYDKD